MEQIGYSLIDGAGNEVDHWGDTLGRSPGIPNPITLPNGNQVHVPSLNTNYQGYKLVERWLGEGGPSVTFDGTRVNVLRVTPPEVVAEKARQDAYKADSTRQDLLTRLQSATPAQIDTWVNNNVTDLASARNVIKIILKVIALDIRT